MANDRVFAVCNGCGAWKMLLKHYPGMLCTRNNGILEWIDAHCVCHPHFYDNELGGDPGFRLVTEGEDFGDLDLTKQNASPPVEVP